MSQIKRKIQEINNPAVHNRRSFNTVGKVTKINEKTNTCSVQYINNEGSYSNKDNVHIQLIMPGFIGWFPKVDEYVYLSIVERNMVVVGPADNMYSSETRSKIQTKKEILSNEYGSTLAGNIF